jgi:hypothetical protein
MIGKEAAKGLNKHWERGPGDPDIGELDGEQVRLDDVEDTIHPSRWPNVVVDRPGVGKVRPWRGLWGF